MNRAEETEIHKEIQANAFFHDFLLFLEEARRDPFRLTESGNLRLGDIHYLGEHFHLNIIRRYIYGEKGEYIRSEKNVPLLRRIHLHTCHMGLTETGSNKRKLLLSQSGKAFLETLSVQAQFEQMILWYLKRYTWADWYSWCSRVASILQREQHFIWSYFLSRQNSRIGFGQFLSGLREYFRLDERVHDPLVYDTIHAAVKRMLVQDLGMFGLLTVESVGSQDLMDEETIYSFQPSTLGVHIFTLALADSTPMQTKRKGESPVS